MSTRQHDDVRSVCRYFSYFPYKDVFLIYWEDVNKQIQYDTLIMYEHFADIAVMFHMKLLLRFRSFRPNIIIHIKNFYKLIIIICTPSMCTYIDQKRVPVCWDQQWIKYLGDVTFCILFFVWVVQTDTNVLRNLEI